MDTILDGHQITSKIRGRRVGLVMLLLLATLVIRRERTGELSAFFGMVHYFGKTVAFGSVRAVWKDGVYCAPWFAAVKKEGENSIVVCTAELYANVIKGSTVSQFKLSEAMYLAIMSPSVRLNLSASPFVCGWYADAVLCTILHSVRSASTASERNTHPRSLSSSHGAPWRKTSERRMNPPTSRAVAAGNAAVSA